MVSIKKGLGLAVVALSSRQALAQGPFTFSLKKRDEKLPTPQDMELVGNIIKQHTKDIAELKTKSSEQENTQQENTFPYHAMFTGMLGLAVMYQQRQINKQNMVLNNTRNELNTTQKNTAIMTHAVQQKFKNLQEEIVKLKLSSAVAKDRQLPSDSSHSDNSSPPTPEQRNP